MHDENAPGCVVRCCGELHGLLLRWAELAPGECNYRDYMPSFSLVREWIPRGSMDRFSGFPLYFRHGGIVEADDDDLARVHRHVVECAGRRGLDVRLTSPPLATLRFYLDLIQAV